MSTIFVTGGTGLIGSVACEQLRGQGHDVRALVRRGSDAQALRELGVHIVEGDVTDAASVLEGARGCEAAIHCAALLGGPQQDPSGQEAVNVGGSINVFDAARRLGLRRVVTLSTTTFFDVSGGPLTEQSPIDPAPSSDPYTQTKLRAFREAMARADSGDDIVVVIPGGTYGPAPQVARALEPPSFNLRAVWALRKEYDAYVRFPVPWSLAADVAACAVAAIDRGVRGERYLAFGTPDDVASIADFMNRACKIAGVDHHVHDLTGDELDDPETQLRYGPSIIALGRRTFPEPFFDNRRTVERLDYHPTGLDQGLRLTVDWLYANRLV